MGTLTIIFTVRMYGIPIAVVLSLVTSSILLGMKLDKLTLLKHWCAGLRHWSPTRLLSAPLLHLPQVG